MNPANIREHGALGASQLEVRALREQLAAACDYQAAIASLVACVRDEVAAVRERDAALAQVAAVRALCDDADNGGEWATSAVAVCRVRAALDGDGSAPPASRSAPTQERVEPLGGTSGPPTNSVPANATPPTEGEHR